MTDDEWSFQFTPDQWDLICSHSHAQVAFLEVAETTDEDFERTDMVWGLLSRLEACPPGHCWSCGAQLVSVGVLSRCFGCDGFDVQSWAPRPPRLRSV